MKHRFLRHILQFAGGALVCAALLTSAPLPALPASGGTQIGPETDRVSGGTQVGQETNKADGESGRTGNGTKEDEPSDPAPGKGKEIGNKPDVRPQSDNDDEIDFRTN